LKEVTCKITDKDSATKTKEIIKKIISCLMIMAINPRVEPIARLPTSPMKIFAGFKLKVKNAQIEPIIQTQKKIISPLNLICVRFKCSAILGVEIQKSSELNKQD